MSASKLCQVIAVEKGIKASAERSLTDVYHKLQKGQLLTGIARTYRPKDDEGDKLPSESTLVQVTVDDIVKSVTETLVNQLDITATKDFANCEAKADIVVDGKTLAFQVPVTYLLFLEKKLVDIRTFVSKLPTLDPSEKWTFDENANCFASSPADTTRTKKVMKNHVKAEASERHPAQVEVFTEDEIVGYWTTVKFSGAIPAKKQKELLDRVEKLQHAVKFTREACNSIEVKNVRIGDALFGYIFDSK